VLDGEKNNGAVSEKVIKTREIKICKNFN